MNYCPHCGEKVNPDQTVCLNCGKFLDSANTSPTKVAEDNGGGGWTLLGFFMPLIGVILYVIWINERPNTAKSLIKGVFTSLIVAGVIFVLWIIIAVIIVGTMGLSQYLALLI
ncbi:zinc ribbon domain-containing protein [Acholeplasma hippikon]|uniref:Predicted membrane protein n=1 Tax=Acholeplasma hippikon TaxID=264636 RepID=A0A449BI02_9MOLU|nr:zinc ribbon domain-containing protein [Acholeplasma hippikon]VEU82091.1 Predicted membrane protein [Acholeplasma hippikon]